MIDLKDLPDCPVETSLLLMGDRWKLLIVRELLLGTKRFGELKKSLNGISQKVLTQHLRAMEESGLVNRKVYAEVPPRVEYSLTETGYSLKSVHDVLWEWGLHYKTTLND
ncbi:MarR family transcriptional regulator [Erysipelothrix larvae]|uniref:MarR family transcriptional regulator n=1 Tax=Erysipelothrix larvae TaxID=1514105 RepID=A0A109UGQ7_9FIRM|nr:helix-turn-helix domain-containing protein [Erysipelothrix larvae]AMC93046.1 MarR family transcriptional regulator [Erysipelothrix larvae]